MKSNIGILIAATLAFVVVGCAKDQTLDEYHQNQAEQDVARLGTFAGTYTGTLTNKDTNQSIGALEIDLNAQLTTTPNSDNTENTISAGLVGQGIITTSQNGLGVGSISSATCITYNDSSTCPFSGTIAATLSNGQTANLTISGTISGNTFNGNFTSSNGLIYDNSFTLTKSNVAPGTAQLNSSSGHQPTPNSGRHKYKGSYQSIDLGSLFGPGSGSDSSKGKTKTLSTSSSNGNGDTQAVYLLIDSSSDTPAENFINAVSRQPLVTVSMSTQDPDASSTSSIDASTSISIPDTYLNEIAGSFTAKTIQAISASRSCTLTLSCGQGAMYNPSAAWNCSYTNTCGNSISFPANPSN